MQNAEQRKRALVGEPEALTGRPQTGASLDAERLRGELRRHVVAIRELLGKDILRTRKILRRLLIGRLEPYEGRGSATGSPGGGRMRRSCPRRFHT